MAKRARRHAGVTILLSFLTLIGTTGPITAQGLGGAGTIQGIVKDPTGGVMQAVEVTIKNPVSGFNRTATTDAAGKYVFNNLPPNTYHVAVQAQGIGVEDDAEYAAQVRQANELFEAEWVQFLYDCGTD